MSIGIDYGRGLTNINLETGIRYGVISQHAIMGEALAAFEPDYGSATCPKCGSDIISSGDTDFEKHPGKDYFCQCCFDSAREDADEPLDVDRHKFTYWSDQCFGDDPLAHYLDDSEYTASMGECGDIFVIRSPYYTRAAFCSPCAPGACHLSSPCDDGAKAYCLGPDFFDDYSPCPYPIYLVENDSLVTT